MQYWHSDDFQQVLQVHCHWRSCHRAMERTLCLSVHEFVCDIVPDTVQLLHQLNVALSQEACEETAFLIHPCVWKHIYFLMSQLNQYKFIYHQTSTPFNFIRFFIFFFFLGGGGVWKKTEFKVYGTTAELSGGLTGHSVDTGVEEATGRLQELHDLLEDQPGLWALARPVH